MLDRQPLLWLNARNRLKPATVWFFLFCMGLLWIWDCSQLGSFMWEADHCLFAVFLLHSIIKIWIGVESCGRFADDQRTGAMELLLTAPTSEHEFFEAHKLAIKRQFALPVVAVLAFDLFVLANVMPAQGFWKTRWLESLPDIRLIFVAIMILLVIDILAICWVGVWEGIFAKSANRALGITLAKVLVMPSFVFLCSQGFFLGFINFLGVNFFGVLAPQSTRMRLSILLWIVTGLTFSLILRKRALAALREKFRVIASERYQGKASDPKSGPPTPTVLTVPHASTANR